MRTLLLTAALVAGCSLVAGCAGSVESAPAPATVAATVAATATVTTTATVTVTPPRTTPPPVPLPTDADQQMAKITTLWKKALEGQQQAYCDFYAENPTQAAKELREGVGSNEFDTVVIRAYFDRECDTRRGS